MARMKFLCDAERCIECNACVTVCNNEHEVPWGMNRRHVVTLKDGDEGEKSISVACMHCTDAPCAAVCPVRWTASSSTIKTCASAAATVSTPVHSERPSTQNRRPLVCAAKWTSAPFALEVRCRTIQTKNIKNTGATELLKVSFPCVPRCVPLRLFSEAMEMSSPTSTESGSWRAAEDLIPGVGRKPTRNRTISTGVSCESDSRKSFSDHCSDLMGDYKGRNDPLLAKQQTVDQQQELVQRFKQVQTDR